MLFLPVSGYGKKLRDLTKFRSFYEIRYPFILELVTLFVPGPPLPAEKDYFCTGLPRGGSGWSSGQSQLFACSFSPAGLGTARCRGSCCVSPIRIGFSPVTVSASRAAGAGAVLFSGGKSISPNIVAKMAMVRDRAMLTNIANMFLAFPRFHVSSSPGGRPGGRNTVLVTIMVSAK